jgi:hypothetical protein
MTTSSSLRVRALLLSSFLLTAVIACQIVGCNRKARTLPTNEGTDTDQSATVDMILENQQPDLYELNTPRDIPIRDLNSWANSEMQSMLVPEQTDEQLQAALEQYADADFVKQTMRENFILRDALYIRDCLWTSGMAQSIRQKGDTMIQSVVRLFYQTANEIVLIEKDQAIPLGPFHSMMFGRGRAEDRAWVFAMFVAQHRIPVGVFQFEDPKLPLVAGAVIAGDVYLFDCSHGIPIANALDISDGRPWLESPVTLASVIKDEKSLDGMSNAGFDYPLTSADFKTAKFALVGDSSTWSRRMEALNQALAGKTDALVGQNFASYGSGQDEVIGDVVAVETAIANLLPAKSVTVWSYPQTQRIARENHTQDDKTRVRIWKAPFSVPRAILGWAPLKFAPSQFKQRAARASQIIGKPEAAIPIYIVVQRWDILPPLGKDVQAVREQDKLAVGQKLPKPIINMHVLAAEQAFFWRATAQLQKREYKSACITFDLYLRKYFAVPRDKNYIDYLTEAAYLTALSEVRIRRADLESDDELELHFRRGLRFMERVKAGSSRYGAAQIFLARWDAIKAKNDALAEEKTNKPETNAKEN